MNDSSQTAHPSPHNAAFLLTTKEAADFLTISPRTLAEWRAAKMIPVIERPGYVRFLRTDLEDFLRKHRTAALRAAPYRVRKKQPQKLEQPHSTTDSSTEL